MRPYTTPSTMGSVGICVGLRHSGASSSVHVARATRCVRVRPTSSVLLGISGTAQCWASLREWKCLWAWCVWSILASLRRAGFACAAAESRVRCRRWDFQGQVMLATGQQRSRFYTGASLCVAGLRTADGMLSVD